jgi:hypothetical protein
VELTIRHVGRVIRREKKKVSTEHLAKLALLTNCYNRLLATANGMDSQDGAPNHHDLVEEHPGAKALAKMKGGL